MLQNKEVRAMTAIIFILALLAVLPIACALATKEE